MPAIFRLLFFACGADMTESGRFNEIYLSLSIRKSEGKTDEYGNYIFEVEASNENVDLQDQIVLQRALMESKDEFLKGGVISYDHLHKRKDENGNVVSDPSMVIGEPVDVRFDTASKSTVVTGKLYATNEKAKELIKMLKAGSTRIRASVGGIFPKIVKDMKTGIEKITHVLWNDLALTVTPVNNTVGSAGFAKSMDAGEFVASLPEEMRKALSAGYETDSTEKEGGRALIGEDAGRKVFDTPAERAGEEADGDEEKAILELMEFARKGRIHGREDAVAFLADRGISRAKAGEIIPEIIEQGERMMKKSFSKHISSLLKSLSKGNPEDGEDLDEELDLTDGGGEDSAAEEDEVLEKADGEDVDPEDGEDEEDGGTSEDEEDEDEEEAWDEDEDAENGESVMKALGEELRLLRKSMRNMKAVQDKLARVLVDVARTVNEIGDEPVPARSVLNKSLAKRSGGSGRPDRADLDEVNRILVRAVREGKIDLVKSSLISSDFQKSMVTGRPMKKEFYDFLQAEHANGGN